jgi:DNA-binding transcriptional MerR regulator
MTEENLQSMTVRNKKIMNLIANTNIILLSTLEDLADLMMDSMGAVAAGIAEAIDEVEQDPPEANEKVKAVVSNVRQDVYRQMKQKKDSIEKYLPDPRFDDALKIVDAYEFKLPKLTEELDEATLTAYLQLLISENPKFNEMFKKLTTLMNEMQ